MITAKPTPGTREAISMSNWDFRYDHDKVDAVIRTGVLNALGDTVEPTPVDIVIDIIRESMADAIRETFCNADDRFLYGLDGVRVGFPWATQHQSDKRPFVTDPLMVAVTLPLNEEAGTTDEPTWHISLSTLFANAVEGLGEERDDDGRYYKTVKDRDNLIVFADALQVELARIRKDIADVVLIDEEGEEI